MAQSQSERIVRVVTSFFSYDKKTTDDRVPSRLIVNKHTHKYFNDFKRHVQDFLGIKEASAKRGFGVFDLRIFRIHTDLNSQSQQNCIIETQWELEILDLLVDTLSESNGGCYCKT